MFTPPPFHPDRPGLVAPVRVDRRGVRGPTPGQARGPGWRRTSQGFYVPSSVPVTASQRIVEAAALLHPGGVVTGWAALCWLEGRWFDGTADDQATPLDVPLLTVRHLRPQPGVRVSQEFLDPADVIRIDGLPVSHPVRSVSQEVRRSASLGEAVAVIDMAAYSDLVSIRELREYAARLGPVTGIGRLREALLHADENAWSPPEVTMRLAWEAAGFPRPLTNVPVFDLTGRHVATPDLLDPVAGVAGEYEGSLHLLGARRAVDVAREGQVLRTGLESVTMVSVDLRDHAEFQARLADAYRRAATRRTPERTWTIEPPAWWRPTLTVDQRRALGERDRERLLAHRRAA